MQQNNSDEKTGFGLGDFVYVFANPIAKTIDAVAGTQIQGCSACAQRRAKLNEIMPHFPFVTTLAQNDPAKKPAP
jgi:hypothetical protein